MIYKTAPEFRTDKGVGHGVAISPKLFRATPEEIYSQLDWTNKGLKIDGEYLNHLRFANDIVLIANSRV